MRRVLLTGGTGDIGARLLIDLIDDGNFVYFTTKSFDKGREIMEKFKLDTSSCAPIVVDFFEDKAIDSILTQITEPPSILINNARSLETLRIGADGRVGVNGFQNEFFMGVTFPYLLTMSLLTFENCLKDVIFISSMYGSVAPNPSLYDDFDGQSPINYGVVKASQIHLVKELAVRLSKFDVRVNAVSYGGLNTRVSTDFEERYSRLVPLNRMINYNDLYPPIQFLVNNQLLAITGENLKIDGGWTIW